MALKSGSFSVLIEIVGGVLLGHPEEKIHRDVSARDENSQNDQCPWRT